jgi:hypothetical protein
MASVIFDKLWAAAVEREGELFAHALALAQAHRIASAMEAIKLARALHESGRSFFEYCEAAYKAEENVILDRVRRRHHLSPEEMKFVKRLLDKASKGHW